MRYQLSDQEWSIIHSMLTTKPRGVPRVDDRRVLTRHVVSLYGAPSGFWQDPTSGSGKAGRALASLPFVDSGRQRAALFLRNLLAVAALLCARD
jgi:transposase